ncbi:MAG: ErfK/YbiS/YcfS/YnhG family protein [Berkelbacteria bacterium GW2011_GWA2_35_9]|uniref:ErfK/YbiS/YcfS/YnhG family protein n=1 Tax=Berkelbacteria bacterium GW2011_GWA2_35_9 TaxID=1618333 RepID=A0A0G0FMZ3_9BACT|nr:MAG: ErfK/YbiS/YcfS/YnhG family protein [Berkelbacteria bacterium GW2011_GWA2_35_9]
MNREKIALLITIISALIISLLVITLMFIKSQLIIAKVSVGGVNIGLMDKINAYQIISAKIPSQITFKYGSDILFQGDKTEIGLIYDPVKSIIEAQKINRSFDNIAYAKNISIPVIYNEDAIISKINKLPENYQPAQNAKLEITNGIISEVKEINGLEFDFNQLANSITNNPFSGEYELTMIESQPNIKLEDLSKTKADVENILKTNLTLTQNKKIKERIEVKIISTLIGFEQLDSEVKAVVEEAKIDKYLDTLKNRLSVKASPVVKYQNGEIADNGKIGSQLNIEKLKKDILDNIAQEKNIELEFIETDPATKIVEQPFQPGLYAGKYIEIDLSTQRLAAFNGQNKDYEFVVSSGKWSMPTPSGTFTINSKNPRAYSSKYNLYMPYWMAFIGSTYGLHALPEWANGYKEGENHLGVPVSHGCVRLSTENASTLYNWAEIGTTVVIHK